MAGLTPSEVEVAEVHDCFTIAELLAMEDLGFCQPGTASDAVLHEETAAYNTARSGKLPIVNHSGGLKACGHPVGATGVKQVAYLSQLLASGAYNTALAHNVGGSGATAVVTLLATETKQNASTDSTKKRKKSL